MQFGNPMMLWLAALLLPLLVWFVWRAWRRKTALMTQFIQARLLPQLSAGVSPARQKLRLALFLAAVATLLLALARPQWGFKWEEARQRGVDIVVAIDTSRSMLAADIAPNRLTRAKLAALDLLRLARSDRLGLVAFAGTAFLQCPLTLDDEAFRQSVNLLDTQIIPQGGTAIAGAIETALTAFKDEENYRALVLFTDGEDHDAGAREAAEAAAKKGLIIYTIGVGTPQGEVLQQTDEKGVKSFVKDESGNVVKSRIDEPLLQEIATAGNGFYLNLRGAGAIDTLYNHERGLKSLPKNESTTKLVQNYYERFQWPLALAILLLVVELLLPDRPRERQAQATAQPAATATVVLLLVIGGPLGVSAAPAPAIPGGNGPITPLAPRTEKVAEPELPADPRRAFRQGVTEFSRGNFPQAARLFGKSTTSADLRVQERAFYDLGSALYRQGEQMEDGQPKLQTWSQSAAQFENALHLDAKDADAKHNLELVRKKIEALKEKLPKQPQQDKKQDKQEQKDDQKQEQQSKPEDQEQKSDGKPQEQPSEQQNDQQQTPQSSDEKKDEQSQQQDQKQPDQNDKSEQAQDQAGKEGKDQKPAGSGDQEQKEGDDQPAGAEEGKPGQMAPQQVRQLLDSQRGEDKAMIFLPKRDPKAARTRGFKDW